MKHLVWKAQCGLLHRRSAYSEADPNGVVLAMDPVCDVVQQAPNGQLLQGHWGRQTTANQSGPHLPHTVPVPYTGHREATVCTQKAVESTLVKTCMLWEHIKQEMKSLSQQNKGTFRGLCFFVKFKWHYRNCENTSCRVWKYPFQECMFVEAALSNPSPFFIYTCFQLKSHRRKLCCSCWVNHVNPILTAMEGWNLCFPLTVLILWTFSY